MSYAIITDGVCTNIVKASEEFAIEMGWIALPSGYGIGDKYDGEKWEKGTPEPIPESEEVETADDVLNALLGVI